MIQLKPLLESLEYNPTVLRVYRSISLELKDDYYEWDNLCQKIATVYYNIGGEKPNKVSQRMIFESHPYKCMANSYPVEFIPIMVNMIKEHIKDGR